MRCKYLNTLHFQRESNPHPRQYRPKSNKEPNFAQNIVDARFQRMPQQPENFQAKETSNSHQRAKTGPNVREPQQLQQFNMIGDTLFRLALALANAITSERGETSPFEYAPLNMRLSPISFQGFRRGRGSILYAQSIQADIKHRYPWRGKLCVSGPWSWAPDLKI